MLCYLTTIEAKLYNSIDQCWREDPNWGAKRQRLADCAKGFGASAQGGKNGAEYVVTDPSDDPENPKFGTLRYGVIQTEPLWITFQTDMNIVLEEELLVNSYKTIDGRGAQIRIGDGPCIRVAKVSHVIIHGLTIENCQKHKSGPARWVDNRKRSDGDGIRVLRSNNIWIDHCRLSSCKDGLIDVSLSSTYITISNNYFSNHRKVMLLGHSDKFLRDVNMKVTVAFNYFGPELVSRMPRARFGSFHVANNRYEKWLQYAIGGSMNPTILSEGNHFDAPDNPDAKEVTWKKIKKGGDRGERWSWTSKGDAFLNGAYFNGSGIPWEPDYTQTQYFAAAPAHEVVELTQDAGPLQCDPTQGC
ncbi:OLC1v1020733C1 [Oldenlandia corymbosa var. corymbosa]|uniref:Pectate lyase n=1 Tax=Oldenlandia corymbosa var. corymbosa TaxID=529605 RepID=A0AAV1BW66_OLDCO|nr:OLC1v1020733C1 [Oldenlandia corymbosa var. corymbosa]